MTTARIPGSTLLLATLALLAPSTASAAVTIDASAIPLTQDGSQALPQDADGTYLRVLNNFEVIPIKLQVNLAASVSGAVGGSFDVFLVYRIPGSSDFFNDTGMVITQPVQADGTATISTSYLSGVPLDPGTYDVSLHWNAQVQGTFGAQTIDGETPALFRVDVALAAPAPTSAPPTSVRLVGVPDPIQADTVVPAASLPSLTITDDTLTTYAVTWTFSDSIALIDGATTPVSSFTETIAVPAGTTSPAIIHLGDGDPIASGMRSLAFSKQGLFTVSATVAEAGIDCPVTSNAGDNTIVVYDPFSSAAASGKGALDIASAKQQARLNFSLSYKNGVGKGNLVYNSPGENVSFAASAIGYLTVSGSAGVSEGDGTLNNVAGWHYKLNVDGATNSFQLVLTGPGATYAVGPQALSQSKNGDITVTAPPNG